MKKKILESLVAVLFFLIIFSCSANVESLSVRANVKSETGKDVYFKVFLENMAGQSVNGAFVAATSSSEILELLENENQCYSGSLNGSENDIYTITIKSNLVKEPYILEVPHTIFQKL